MGKYKDYINIQTKKFDLLKQKSIVHHQYKNNIGESGLLIELEIRQLFNEILPSRFRATHGYIAYSESIEKEPSLTPQIDLIIVDNFVPNTLYKIDSSNSYEIVPVESVVGVFEIKRTINKKSLLGTKSSTGAFEHLYNVTKAVNITKSNSKKYLPGGIQFGTGFSGGVYSNPIIGILGLETTENMSNLDSKYSIHNYINSAKLKPHIDLITSLGDFIYAPTYDDTNLTVIDYLDPNKQFSYILYNNSKVSKDYLMSSAIGYILHYVNKVCGTNTNLVNFYLNKSIK